ncbi:MAG TPA: hypothetical protein VK835_05695 [Bacteroidia bacterium]|jgi:hypothetical protein|nr:hypothetical protein [Bacteroidia bacterium]
MEDKKPFIEPLFERVEEYGKTSLELIKLKTVDKATDVASTFISRGVMMPVFLMCAVLINIGVALWLGDLLGKLYNGFFIVAGFYAIVGLILYFFREQIKKSVSNLIILQILN